jgi:hypothetical protein
MALTRINGNLISSGTITGNLFLSNTITGNLIAPAAVTGDKIGLTAITGNLVASATITGDKIGLTAITSNLIATGVTLTSPVLASANLITALTLAGATGNNGQVLTSAGSGLPSWATPSAGALTFISSVTASSSATVDIETTFNSTYRTYLIIGTDIYCDETSVFNCRLKIGGSYITTSSYGYHRHDLTAGTSAYQAAASDGGNLIPISAALATARSGHFVMTVHMPSDTASEKSIAWQFTTGRLNNNFSTGAIGNGSNSGTSALTGVRFFFNSGNIASGQFKLYGITNS